MTKKEWTNLIDTLDDAADKLHSAAGQASKATGIADDSLRRDIELLADQGFDLYRQATVLKLRAEQARESAPA